MKLIMENWRKFVTEIDRYPAPGTLPGEREAEDEHYRVEKILDDFFENLYKNKFEIFNDNIKVKMRSESEFIVDEDGDISYFTSDKELEDFLKQKLSEYEENLRMDRF